MNNEKYIEEACKEIFPIFLKAVMETPEYWEMYPYIEKWRKATLDILNEVYPENVKMFTDENEPFVKNLNIIREILGGGKI